MSSALISTEKQPVILVVVFVLALLSLVFTFYNNQQIERVASFYGVVSMKTFETLEDQVGDASVNFTALETRVARLEGQGAAASVPEVQVN